MSNTIRNYPKDLLRGFEGEEEFIEEMQRDHISITKSVNGYDEVSGQRSKRNRKRDIHRAERRKKFDNDFV